MAPEESQIGQVEQLSEQAEIKEGILLSMG